MDEDKKWRVPTSKAAALRLHAALAEEGRELSLHAESLSDEENLRQFTERLQAVRDNRFWRTEEPPLRDPAVRRPRGDEPGADFEREAARRWRDACAVPCSDLNLPLAVSAKVVAYLAHKYGLEHHDVRSADELSAMLAKHVLSPPEDVVMELADRVQLLVEGLLRRVRRPGDGVESASDDAPASGDAIAPTGDARAKPRRLSAADKVLAVVGRLTRDGRFGVTQKEVAEMAGCDPRTLRRGAAQNAWKQYLAAGSRAPDSPGPTSAQSRQAKLQAEKMRDEGQRGRD